MSTPQQKPEIPPERSPSPRSISRSPPPESTNYPTDGQPVPRCVMCHVRDGQTRDFIKFIVIEISGKDDSYCDICLEQQLQNESIEVKMLEERFIYQKQFETSISEGDKKVLSFQKDPNSDVIRKELEQLEAQQMELDRTLTNVKGDCKELQAKVYMLEHKEEKFWVDLNKFEKRAIKLEEKAFLAKNQREVEKKALEELSKTSIVHKFFQIEIEDTFAQICGLALGKKPDQIDVNWEETNAALGHILLAYNYLVMKYGITYTRLADIKIKGHLSEVKLRTSETYYPVAYTGREGEKVFGIVMDNLLAELAELSQHIQEIEKIEYTEELKLPFFIVKKEGKIVDLLVNPAKIEDKNRWSQWTKAMRYFLIDLKHLLTISLLTDPYL